MRQAEKLVAGLLMDDLEVPCDSAALRLLLPGSWEAER
jgi:hypothetical protein